MSASITLHCNRTDRYSGCAAQLFTDAPTIADARALAAERGWHYSPGEGVQDLCPQHASGRPGPLAQVAYIGDRR